MQASITSICFDLDGTLVDSAPDLSFALGAALESVGFEPPTEAQTRGWIGDGIDNLLRRALSDSGSEDSATFHAALSAFHGSYSQNLFSRSRLYPNVTPCLDSLRASGMRLACITNKRSDYAHALLERAGLGGYFEVTFGGDSFAEKKPHPVQLVEAARRLGSEPANCVMIGDSDTDALAAAAAGFRFIWAAFGYCPALRSRDCATVPTVAEVADIPAVLATLVP